MRSALTPALGVCKSMRFGWVRCSSVTPESETARLQAAALRAEPVDLVPDARHCVQQLCHCRTTVGAALRGDARRGLQLGQERGHLRQQRILVTMLLLCGTPV